MWTTCGTPETEVSGSETGARLEMLAVLRARAGRAGIGLGWRKGGVVQGYGARQGHGEAHRVPLRQHHGVLDARRVLKPGRIEWVDVASRAQRLATDIVYGDEVR